MSPRKGRHPRRRGPGGPQRTSRSGRAEVVPIGRAASARHRDGLLGPSVDNLVAALLRTLRELAPSGDPEARPVAVEVWADRMAATMYGPEAMPPEFYADLADGLLGSLDPDAPAALAALAHVLAHADAEPLRQVHAEHRDRVGTDDQSDLGIGRATARRAFEVDHVQGDGVTLLVDVDQPGAPHCVGVYIDHNLGGLAKDLLVGPPWDQVAQEELYSSVPGMTVREVSLAEVRVRYDDAIALTDHTLDPPVSDDFEDTRALVERRMALLPEGGTPPERIVLEAEEIEALVGDFLASPEAATLTPAEHDEAGWLIDLWIAHATGATIGGPYRLSPILVELFCLDWYPRQALPDPATVAAAPAVLSAWVHHAARLTGLDDEWRDEALRAVATLAPEMASDATDRSPDGEALDGLDPDLRTALLDQLATNGLTEDDVRRELDDGSRLLQPFDRSEGTGSWVPLCPGPPGPRRVHWEADPSGVLPEVASKVKAICLQCSFAADLFLGPDFVQPAVDLAVLIGGLDPSPLPHTQDAVWSSAVIWLLADDSAGFSRTLGRTRDDLASALPLARGTITKRVTEIRGRLGLAKGDRAVAWE